MVSTASNYAKLLLVLLYLILLNSFVIEKKTNLQINQPLDFTNPKPMYRGKIISINKVIQTNSGIFGMQETESREAVATCHECFHSCYSDIKGTRVRRDLND
ncbi:hypothetical protein L596_016783 [Steinernema carpocapsae]|uniref:Uncharacterized protein n=1 Tax=Steinernema carpocapsae TaxID=34508 RepID=A0A4U5NJZ5_STECR|nr:hypothetical protein L596_016783 [Steinernema carpocapsae]